VNYIKETGLEGETRKQKQMVTRQSLFTPSASCRFEKEYNTRPL